MCDIIKVNINRRMGAHPHFCDITEMISSDAEAIYCVKKAGVMMTDSEQRAAAKKFAQDWAGRGDEKSDTQTFWITLLHDVYGMSDPAQDIEFEKRVMLDNTSFIDVYIKPTQVMIEQKSIHKDLNKPIRQSDGKLLSPNGQLQRYAGALGKTMYPRWGITCNFKEFHIYDMDPPRQDAEVLKLADLPEQYHRLNFLVDTGDANVKQEEQVSLKAGELVGVLYDAILEKYNDPENKETLRSLNKLCVRLVFCLYAEDAGLFPRHGQFHNYIKKVADRDISQARKALVELFRTLDTPKEQRDPYDDPELLAFPYVNGGLFKDENIEIPRIDEHIVGLLLGECSENFDWSKISPTIFGAVFESTLNPQTRRAGGMHYTSVENIHKVIDPLFLNDLKAEFSAIKARPYSDSWRKRYLTDYRKKLSSLVFFDPACGSGNFLTETFLCIRRLENEVIRELSETTLGQTAMEGLDKSDVGIEVSIDQFYGIEINDFAVTVARTALWIAESQTMKETEEIIGLPMQFLPLHTYTKITEGNALTIDWSAAAPKERLTYIMGNPPFVGSSMMSKEQKAEAVAIFGKIKLSNSIDYVGAWYYKAAALIARTKIRVAFVSTNSITQGEQVAPLWQTLFQKYGIHIDFAYRTFRWDSEASLKAHVHCVIIGFSTVSNTKERYIYSEDGRYQKAANINPYLVDAPTVFIESRNRAICNVPNMTKGNQPSDGGNFIMTQDEMEEIVKREPQTEKYIHKYIGSEEYINNKVRYCFWLKDASPSDIMQSKELMRRVQAVIEMREKSSAAPTRAKANTPTRFFSETQPSCNYLMIPRVSSEKRKYIPIGFATPDIIASDSCSIIPSDSLYLFGVLISAVHMNWMRTVAGRLKSDYRYSGSVVYNNFPWPNPTKEQKELIEQTAKQILEARALYPGSSLADMYGDKRKLFGALITAHQANDAAVMDAYGFTKGTAARTGEAACVAELMKLYQKIVAEIT